MRLDALKSEIGKLSPQDRAALAEWFGQQEDETWDQRIRSDYRAGKLDELIRRADKEFDDGTIRETP